MKLMLLKNLESHRARNKMTSIIYSIALGFVIFLVVTYNIQIKTIELQSVQYKGSYFYISTGAQDILKPA